MNPLLDFSGLPRFASIDAASVSPAIDQLIAAANSAVQNLCASSEDPTWENFVAPLDEANEKLSRAWGVVGHLNAVVNTPALREAYNGKLPAVTQYWTSLAQNETLYAKYKSIRASAAGQKLSAVQIRVLDNELRDFRLGGADLPADKKQRFQQVQEELSNLTARFNDNVLDATNDFACYIDNEAELSGLPDDVKDAARAAAEADGKPGWKLTLHMPSYLPVMQYADFHPLRERMYRAYVCRASELGADPKWDNSEIMRQVLGLRAETAALLGYGNYAEVSLATKMAEKPAEVVDFLQQMVGRAKPFAQRDWQQLTEFAQRELNMAEVRAWDVAYVAEKLRQKSYAFSDNDVKQYFPEPQVLAGLFRVVETLYGVTMRAAETDTWHPDVRFFDIVQKDGTLVGQFYLDLYARSGKRGGAWMDDAINRRRSTDAAGKATLQHPVAFLTCNFSAPPAAAASNGERQPALFTHDEVITLFHEFGHGLHQLLTEVDELNVSGINGVEWDAVELPSQFMENFCWEWDVLSHMTRHADTGAPLPRELFDKMIAAKNFGAGMHFVRQLEFGLFDMRLHAAGGVNPAAGAVLDLLKEVRAQVAVIPYPDFNRMPNTFGHIFGGGYAAGYYSYMWAEVLSADAYAAFEESGVLNPDTGARFRREVLSRGGSRPALESFVAFRGRKPDIAPLLRHNGMKIAA